MRETRGSSPLRPYLCGTAEVIVIDLFYRLEVDHSLQLGLVFVCGGRRRMRGLFKRLILATDFSQLEKAETLLPRHLE